MPQNNYHDTNANQSALNVSAPVVLKVGRGRVGKISINAPGGTSGTWMINDCATIGAASGTNIVWSLAFGAAANVAGTVIDINFPCQKGIVLSAVPGGTPNASISFK